jgi:hypothetical protein
MTAQERIEAANKALRNYGKRPAAPVPIANKPDAASIRNRIADVRKQVGVAFEQANKLGATELV